MAEKIYSGLVSLPLYPRMTDEDVQYVIDAVTHIVRKNRGKPRTIQLRALGANGSS
jgi:hypothetical protein